MTRWIDITHKECRARAARLAQEINRLERLEQDAAAQWEMYGDQAKLQERAEAAEAVCHSLVRWGRGDTIDLVALAGIRRKAQEIVGKP
jgi:hypothetical protein